MTKPRIKTDGFVKWIAVCEACLWNQGFRGRSVEIIQIYTQEKCYYHGDKLCGFNSGFIVQWGVK